jgi:RNA polymerase sigma-70 factor (ECF subfamily)
MAWRDRDSLEWRGLAAFRRWLLEIARNRIHDLADHTGAKKRGDARPFSDLDDDSDGGDHYAGPVQTTSPGRAAADREVAELLEAALAAVPEENRDVVRLRLFEDLTMEDVAARTGLGVEGVRYRFRHGLEAYRRALRRLRVDGTRGTRDDSAAPDSSP